MPGALVWAAAGKDPGLTPELILDWIKRGAFYTTDQVKKVNLRQRADLVAMRRQWLEAVGEAEALITRLPLEEMGSFYLDAQGSPVCPNPNSPLFAGLTRRFGSVKGAWPSIIE